MGGTYVGHGPNFVARLRLTDNTRGQITGVLDDVDLSADGQITPKQVSIIGGTVDGDQLTLTASGGLLHNNISGSIKRDRITLEMVGPNASPASFLFIRSSSATFKTYTDELQHKADGIVVTARVLSQVRDLRQRIRNAEKWIAGAELHAERIPQVKNYYQNIEEQMRSLIARQRVTSNTVTRSQFAVAVNQADVAGTQADVQVHQTWDIGIGDEGQSLIKVFATAPSHCEDWKELQDRGATLEAAQLWESACKDTVLELEKFGSAFKRITDQREDLRSFQQTAMSRRQALVDEANRTR
jgi:hypothetical protein